MALGFSDAWEKIRFAIQVDCEDEEPSRVVPAVNGEIFDFIDDDDSEKEVRIGSIRAYLVQVGRSLNEKESLFDAMDSIDDSVHGCYAALFECETNEWKDSVDSMYEGGIPGLDVLFIDTINLEPAFRATDITPIVRETIATFASNYGLVGYGSGGTEWGDRREVSLTLKVSVIISQTVLSNKYQKTFRLSPSSEFEDPIMKETSTQ